MVKRWHPIDRPFTPAQVIIKSRKPAGYRALTADEIKQVVQNEMAILHRVAAERR